MSKVPPRIQRPSGSPSTSPVRKTRTAELPARSARSSKTSAPAQPHEASGISNPWGDESSVVHYPEPQRNPVELHAERNSGELPAVDELYDAMLAEAELALPEPPPSPRTPSKKSRHPAGSVMAALDEAEEPGVYYREQRRDGRRADELEDRELAAAVEETIRLLFGVPGIFRIGPGVNEQGERVVVVRAARGFTERSMRAIPSQVHRFKTLVAVPYELLPLRRERT